LEEPHFTKKEREELKEKQRAGLTGPAHSRAPHPEGYIRVGFPTNGRKF